VAEKVVVGIMDMIEDREEEMMKTVI